MATLKIRKVTILPTVLEPTTMYMVPAAGDMMILYVTDSTGTIAYRTTANGDIGPIVTLIINGMKDQPNGIAGLDSNGNVTSLEGQDLSITAGGTPLWKTIVFNSTTLSYYTSRYRHFKNFTYATSMNDGRISRVLSTFRLPNDYEEGTDVIIRTNLTPTQVSASDDVYFLVTGVMANSHINESYTDLTDTNITLSLSQEPAFVRHNLDLITIPGANLLIGADIKITLTRLGGNNLDTFPGNIFIHDTELSYRVARIGTKNSVPNYFV